MHPHPPIYSMRVPLLLALQLRRRVPLKNHYKSDLVRDSYKNIGRLDIHLQI
jgi:hypothetical protein